MGELSWTPPLEVKEEAVDDSIVSSVQPDQRDLGKKLNLGNLVAKLH